ncbi:MAG: hypothetical protein KDC12_02805 [Flavobacteriales bacterium]|nr:hypothetical protein [Flavobacteriales bacterium]
MSTIASFRNDFSTGLFANVKNVFWKYVIIMAVYVVFAMLLAATVLGSFMNVDMMEMFSANPQDFLNELQNNPGFANQMFTPGEQPGIGTIALIYTIGLLVGSWFINFLLTINDASIRGYKESVLESLKKSFSAKIFQQLANIIVIYVIMIALYLAAMVFVFIHWSVFILALLFVFILLTKFILTPAAITHGNMNVFQAIAFSWKKINFRRALLLFLIAFGASIALVVVFLIVAFILGVIGMIPYLGIVLNAVGGIFLYALFASMMYGALSGLYFRYSDDDESEEGGMAIEDHLVAE